MKRLLIAGCGDLGLRLFRALPQSRWHCTGLRRDVAKLPPELDRFAADLTRPASVDDLARQWDAVVVSMTPAERTPQAYRLAYVDALAHLLDRIDCKRLIFVSSTSVFGQDAGEWVDEDSATQPANFNGQILLEAERLAHAAGGLVVRFAGIYGPGRDQLLRQVKTGQARCRARPPQWTNRIHADDCAGVLAHLLELDNPARLYCASDSAPVERCRVLRWLATRLRAPAPAEDGPANGQGKRVSNRRLRATGYQFQYPDYRSGYGALLT